MDLDRIESLLRFNLGVAYSRSGRFDQAFAQWAAALKLRPQDRHLRRLIVREKARADKNRGGKSDGLRFVLGD
jgi:cytochrome c-type biogenesis protein CcmH/NrfG